MNLLFDHTPLDQVKKHEIVKTQETLCQMQICTTILPELKHTINDRLKANGLAISGTTHGWSLDESVEPVPCAEFKGRWHYVCSC